MTDITELALRLKVAAEKATPGNWGYLKTTPFMDAEISAANNTRVVNLLAGDVTEENSAFIALANPNNILALVEALEKAQAINAAAEKLVRCKGRFHGEQNYRALATLFGVTTPDLPPIDGESRAVKLPNRSVGEVMHMSGFSRDYAEGWCSGNDNAIHEMRAAGIQVIEGAQTE
ncbi:TPA: ead/Ea22-like family protein [Raoultella ornithinolytica]